VADANELLRRCHYILCNRLYFSPMNVAEGNNRRFSAPALIPPEKLVDSRKVGFLRRGVARFLWRNLVGRCREYGGDERGHPRLRLDSSVSLPLPTRRYLLPALVLRCLQLSHSNQPSGLIHFHQRGRPDSRLPNVEAGVNPESQFTLAAVPETRLRISPRCVVVGLPFGSFNQGGV